MAGLRTEEGDAEINQEVTKSQICRRYRDCVHRASSFLSWARRLWRRLREHIPDANKVLAGATVILVIIGYWALHDTEETLELSERAWVGPIDAKLDAVPQQGKDIKATVSVRNTGKEPALDFTWDLKAVIATQRDLDNINSTIEKYVRSCFSMPSLHRRQVIYPSTGFGTGFDFSDSIDKSIVDADLVTGTYVVVVRGCLA